MAIHCDTRTGRIYGAKKNTFEWFHEKGHLLFTDLDFGSTMQLYQSYIMQIWMMVVTIAVLLSNIYISIFAVILVGIYSYIGFYEEVWCNKYARIKLKELKKNSGRKKKN